MKHITFRDGRKQLLIPVDDALHAHYQDQFCRGNPSTIQRRRFQTLQNLVKAAIAAEKKGTIKTVFDESEV